MKKLILSLGLGLILASCSGDDAESLSDNINPVEGNKVLLLKVHLTTNAFEGGKELEFDAAESFTITHDYQPPGDFGSIKLIYDEVDATIFDGTIVWAGLGEMTYPVLDEADAFETVGEAADMPALSDFVKVEYDEFAYYPEEIDYQSIWASIDNLQLVKDYRASNPDAKVHLFLYTPSVGIGDPEEWDWFVILKN